MKPGLLGGPGFFLRMRICFILFALVGLTALAAVSRTFTSFADIKAILAAGLDQAPSDLTTSAKWSDWARRQDAAIRTRLEQGDLDSMVNLLLLGSSFTGQPRVTTETLSEATRSGVLRARVDDMVAGIRNPGSNERLVFVRGLLDRQIGRAHV